MVNKMVVVAFLAASSFLVSCDGGKKTEAPATQDTTTVAAATSPVTIDAKAAGTFKVAADQSKLEWKGTKKVKGEHQGTVTLKEGQFDVANGQITSGKVVIDMNSIGSTDLTGEDKEKLDGHLKAEDFFNTSKFPTATFTFKALAGDKLQGSLEIKGISKDIEVAVKSLVVTETGLDVQADFSIDRTLWDIKYGAEGSVENLVADKVINNNIDFKLNLKAVK